MRRLLSPLIALSACLAASLAGAAADLRVESCKLRMDTCALGGPGNGNNFPDPGENAAMIVTLVNMGMGPVDDATNVNAVVSSTTPGVAMTQANASFGTVAAMATVAGAPAITFDLAVAIPCATDLDFTVSITSDQGNFIGSCVLPVPAACTVCIDGPFLNLEACNNRIDTCALGGPGNNNGSADPGEDAGMQLSVSNRGLRDATNVSATVTTTTPGVMITQPTVNFNTIPAAGVSNPMTTVNYTVATSVACGTNIVFDVTITSDQGAVDEVCGIMIPVSCNPCANAPLLTVTNCGTRGDTCALGLGDSNNIPEPGESVSMSIETTNQGLGNATNVMATVTSTTPGVTITQANTSFGNIASLAAVTGTPTILYTLLPTVACGTDLVFNVAFSSGQGPSSDSCTVTIPVPCIPCAGLSANCGLTSDTCATGGPGDADSRADPGEDVTFQIRASNQLSVAANTASAVVTSTTPGVVVTQPNTTFGTIPAMGTAVGVPDIGYRVAASVPCGTDLVFDITFTSDQGMSTSTCVETIPAPCNVCNTGTSCLVVNLDLPTALRGIRVGSTVRFQWTADPALPPEYHLNIVTNKTFLTETNPNSPRLAPVGQGETKCRALNPAVTCDDTTLDARNILYYRALSACDIDGTDEARVCPVSRPCP